MLDAQNTELVSQNNDRRLTAAEFKDLENVPPENEWLANITNVQTRRAYKNDVAEFSKFIGLNESADFRKVKRAHLIAWRKDLESRALAPATIRRKLSAVASLYDFLCEVNSVAFNPVNGVVRPGESSNEGKSPALADEWVRLLLNAPPSHTLKGVRDRAILSALLFHGLRRAEVCSLRVSDVQNRKGVPHFKVMGKRAKIRFIPIHPHTLERISDYLTFAGHANQQNAPLFWPVINPTGGELAKFLTGNAIFKDIVKKYAQQIGVPFGSITVHGLRATAATSALDHEADIAKVQQWLGHENISTTRLYDRRKMKPEDSPTFKVNY